MIAAANQRIYLLNKQFYSSLTLIERVSLHSKIIIVIFFSLNQS